jgi:hypothetical protein
LLSSRYKKKNKLNVDNRHVSPLIALEERRTKRLTTGKESARGEAADIHKEAVMFNQIEVNFTKIERALKKLSENSSNY